MDLTSISTLNSLTEWLRLRNLTYPSFIFLLQSGKNNASVVRIAKMDMDGNILMDLTDTPTGHSTDDCEKGDGRMVGTYRNSIQLFFSFGGWLLKSKLFCFLLFILVILRAHQIFLLLRGQGYLTHCWIKLFYLNHKENFKNDGYPQF